MKRTALTLLGALAAGLALNFQSSTAIAQDTAVLALKIANPVPSEFAAFGYSMAAVGTDLVLIGAPGANAGAPVAGAAYLFGADGTLLITFTNPTPANYDNFGWSVAAGSAWVVIGAVGEGTGAPGAGAAYLFRPSGTLLTTFTNPAPQDYDNFGYSVAAVGSDRVLIGSPWHSTSATWEGVAYLFGPNGALVTTFTNPAPSGGDRFGWSVAAVGMDRVLIGAWGDNTGADYAGAAYLFSTGGALLTTFTNPTPAEDEGFGYAVAAMGSDRVLVGAYNDNTGGLWAGAAYLFSTNGALLTTFTNPTPADVDCFGCSVAAVGADRVLIGAYQDDAGTNDAGAAYLFGTNGVLLTTITNPMPAESDCFGYSVAGVGMDRVLIGAHQDDTGASDAGAAYLFGLQTSTPGAPSLSISFSAAFSTATLSWPAWAGGWVLERTNALPSVAVASWPQMPAPYQTNAGTISAVVTNNPAVGNQFFRLHKL